MGPTDGGKGTPHVGYDLSTYRIEVEVPEEGDLD